MPKSVEINIKKVRYEELLDRTEKDLAKIKKNQVRNKDIMIASIFEFVFAYIVYRIILHFGDQEYAGAVLAPFTWISRLLWIGLLIRGIYFAVRLFIAKHPVQKKYMSCNKVIDELNKEIKKCHERIEEARREYEDALEEEADDRGLIIKEKIKAFENSGARAYSFYEDILSEKEEKERRDRENAPSDIELTIMKGFENK